MNDEDLKLLIAQQVVILKKLEKLEEKINGRFRSVSVQSYVDELRREAEKIIDQIRNW